MSSRGGEAGCHATPRVGDRDIWESWGPATLASSTGAVATSVVALRDAGVRGESLGSTRTDISPACLASSAV